VSSLSREAASGARSLLQNPNDSQVSKTRSRLDHAAARLRAEVGLPRWSATTETSSRVSLRESIVLTKFAPYGLKSQAVRTMTLLAQCSATRLSPSNLERRRFSGRAPSNT
jgi:hypothetical protein